MVQIIDVERQLKALWPVARLDLWLQYMRELEHIDKEKIFDRFDIKWETYVPCPGSVDVSLLSNISLNESYLANNTRPDAAGGLNGSRILQVSSDLFSIGAADTKENDFKQLATLYMNNIQRDIGHLMKLCENSMMPAIDKPTTSNGSQNQNMMAVQSILGHTKEMWTILNRMRPSLCLITDPNAKTFGAQNKTETDK